MPRKRGSALLGNGGGTELRWSLATAACALRGDGGLRRIRLLKNLPLPHLGERWLRNWKELTGGSLADLERGKPCGRSWAGSRERVWEPAGAVGIFPGCRYRL